jgi:hypothetical protein
VSFSTTQSTAGATRAGTDPSICGAGQNSHSVWFRFTAQSVVKLRAETAGSSYNTVLAVFHGAPGSLRQVKCNDDRNENDPTSRVSFKVRPGKTYFIEVTSFGESPGGTLHLQVEPTCASRPATLIGTEGNDLLEGGEDVDYIVGLGGDDTIRGSGRNDRLCGGDGDDLLQGGDGDDSLLGGNGDDTLEGEAGWDTLIGDAGTDTCEGGTGNTSLSGCP